MNRHEMIEKIITILLIVLVLVLYVLKCYNVQLIAYVLLIVEIYTLIKYRKNPILFFVFLCMLYFDYSFLISKYISTTPTLQSVYSQIQYDDTLYIGVACVFIFHAIKLLLLKNVLYQKTDNSHFMRKNDSKEEKKSNIISIFLTICIAIVLIDYLFFDILSLSRTIYEYLIILFVIAFYFSKDNKVIRIILFLLMMVSTAINMINGGRIISLQPIIAYFFINYFEKIDYKKMTIIVALGVVVFTIFGLYGDCIEYGTDFKDLNLSMVIETFKLRKISLDTSISSYWTGLTYIETSKILPISDRLSNFVQYMTAYTIGGTATGYEQLYTLSRQYYVHYYGGYITSYFYYWLGWIGVFGISAFIGKQLQNINNMNSEISEFRKIYIIYLISTLPRWYLYYPTSLIRGTLILFVVYKVLMLAKNSIEKWKEKMEEKT